MERIATLRARLAATLPANQRLRLAMTAIFVEASQSSLKSTLQKPLNRAMHKEFDRHGIPSEGIDFFYLIEKAVRGRLNPRDNAYDDMFQEVAMNLLDTRKGKFTSAWIPAWKKFVAKNPGASVGGLLQRMLQNLVKDVARSLSTGASYIKDIQHTEDDGGQTGDPFDRMEIEDLNEPTSSIYAQQLYDELVSNFRWDKSQDILDTLIDVGSTGFVGTGRATGGIGRILAEKFNTSEQNIGNFRKKFRRDVIQAIRSMDDPNIAEAAKKLLTASSQMENMIRTLDHVLVG